MPYDVIMEGANAPSPNEAYIKTLEAWINSLATQAASCETHKFVSKDIVALIASDLETRHAHAQPARPISRSPILPIFARIRRRSKSTLKSADVVRLETINTDKSILRFNLDDIGWHPQDWDLILANDPFAVEPDTQLTNVLEGMTGTKLPYVRADWFAFAGSRPPLYNRLLNYPNSFQELAQSLGVDVEDDIRRARQACRFPEIWRQR